VVRVAGDREGLPMTQRAGILALAYTVVAVVGVTVLAVSAYYLWLFAHLAGMPDALAWTLPVALDAGAIGATVCWVAAPGKARRWGQGIALGALGGTVAGNILAHLITFGMLPVTAPLVIALGVVYPATLWLLVHLALVLRTEQRNCDDALAELADARAARAVEAAEARTHAAEMSRLRADAEADREATRQTERDATEARQRTKEMAPHAATPTATTKPSRGSGHGKRGTATKQERVAWAVTQLAAGIDLRPRDIDERFGDPRNGWDVLRKAREQHEQRRPVSLVREA
jgi:hypothetical protein